MLEGTRLDELSKTKLVSLLDEYRDVFSATDDDIGQCTLVSHEIHTTGPPRRLPPYRLNPADREFVKTTTTTLAASGLIQPSRSNWAAPVLCVKKKDGSKRLVIDYRQLNAATTRDSFPLPRIDETLDHLYGARLFSVLDCLSGYHQVPLAENSRHLAAFRTQDGLWEPAVMIQGLVNAPATFQRLMQHVLNGLSPYHAMVYLDDVVIFSNSEADHLEALEETLLRFRAAGLKLKSSKVKLARSSLVYLGHLVSSEGVRPG